jgi:hypothetical protein
MPRAKSTYEIAEESEKTLPRLFNESSIHVFTHFFLMTQDHANFTSPTTNFSCVPLLTITVVFVCVFLYVFFCMCVFLVFLFIPNNILDMPVL